MFIVTSDRESVINIGCVPVIYLDGNSIYAEFKNNNSSTYLGRYSSNERAKEVFNKLLKDLFPEEQFVIKIGKDDLQFGEGPGAMIVSNT